MKNPVWAVWLAENCGPCSLLPKALVQQYGSCEEVYRCADSLSKNVGELPVPRDFGRRCSAEDAEQILRRCAEKDITVISLDDDRFPERLSVIDRPPAALYAKGDLSLFYEIDDLPALTVVGTRDMTVHGQKAAHDFAYSLAKGGMLIVSGMAEGIDASAHKGALAAHGKTIAVFGCGADVTFPKINFYLHEQIEREGLTLSEYPPGAPALGFHFPQRNRILAALSGATFVVEAKNRSGSLITANLAADVGRDVYVLMTDYNRRGASALGRLINDGARAVTEPTEIAEDYLGRFGDKLSRSAVAAAVAPLIAADEETPRRTKKTKKPSERPQKAAQDCTKAPETVRRSAFVLPEGLSTNAKIVYNALNVSDPMHVDDIAEKTGLAVSAASAALLELELSGAVKALPGRHYLAS